MMSTDVYFAKRQIDKLFEKLLKKQGKLRVVLPPIDPEKVINEAKELEKTSVIKEIIPEKEEQTIKPEIQAVKTVTKTEEIIEVIPEKEKQTVKSEVEAVKTVIKTEEVIEIADEIVEEEPAEMAQQEILSKEEEADIEKIDKILQEELLEEEEIEALPEEAEEVIQGNLFENILAEKTQEIDENIKEEIEEEQPVKETSDEKKKFSFKNIITEKFKGSNSDETPSRQKAGFKSPEIEEPVVQRVKPQDVISSEDEEDEEIVKILEEKIKKSLPASESKSISLEAQEITSVEINEPDLTYEEEVEYTDSTTQDFESMGELIAIKNPQSKLDYLLLTAYYLQIKESLFKYSLKQLNAKAMPFQGSLIDHSIIHNAVAHDFIEVVPDYNGTAEVTEYRLTPLGENYLLNEL